MARLVEQTGELFMAEVQDAPADLAIELVISSEAYLAALRLAYTVLRPTPWRPVQAEVRFPKALFLDPVVARHIRAAVRFANAAAPAVVRAGGDSELLRTDVPEELRRANPLWYEQEPTIPPIVREGMLAARRAELGSLVLRYLTHPKIRHIELLREVAALWAADLRKHVRFLASAPNAGVRVSVIPTEERVDLEAERVRRARAHNAFLTSKN